MLVGSLGDGPRSSRQLVLWSDEVITLNGMSWRQALARTAAVHLSPPVTTNTG